MYENIEGLRKALLDIRTFVHEGTRYTDIANGETIEQLRVTLNHPVIHILWLEEPKEVSSLLMQAARHLLTMRHPEGEGKPYIEAVKVPWGKGTAKVLSRNALRGIAPDYIAEVMASYIEAHRFKYLKKRAFALFFFSYQVITKIRACT